MKQLAVALLSFGSLAPALLPTPTLADTVVLRGGRALDGELLTYDEKSQEFRVKPKEGGLLTLRRGDVERTLCSETRARATTPRAASPSRLSKSTAAGRSK